MLSKDLASFEFHCPDYDVAMHRVRCIAPKMRPAKNPALRNLYSTFPPLYAQLGMPVLEACLEVSAESGEIPKLDSLPNFAHGVKVKVDVVVGVQDYRQKFTAR